MFNLLKSIHWDDLRIVKAINEQGGLVMAADVLGMNHSTISRRLSALENRLGVALFDRRRHGYVPTSSGAEFIALSNRVECEIHNSVRKVVYASNTSVGHLRVTTSDALLLDFLTPVVADFQTQHEGVRIDVIADNRPLNLARGDSDIALRATLSPPENLVGRRLATIAWAVYGRRSDFQEGSYQLHDLFSRKWVSSAGRLSELDAARFIRQNVCPDRIMYRSDSLAGVMAAIKAGIGVGMLPCMHADLQCDLVRLHTAELSIQGQLWLLTHPDIRKSSRVSAFMTYCAEAILARRELIEGRTPC